MDPKAKTVFLIAITALIVFNVVLFYVFWYQSAQAEKRDEFLKAYQDEKTALDDLASRPSIWHGNQPDSPLQRLRAQTGVVDNCRKKIEDALKDSDALFEDFLKGVSVSGNRVENFISLYNEWVAGVKGLKELLTSAGIYGDSKDVMEIAQSIIDSDVAAVKAIQKKVWIQQRIIYTLLKPAPGKERKPLVMRLLQRGGRPAIDVSFTIEDEKQQEAPDSYKPNAPMFFEIQVSFKVVIDERNLTRLLDELRAYGPHAENDDSTIPVGIRQSESFGSLLKDFAEKLGEPSTFGDPRTGVVFRLKDVLVMRNEDAKVSGVPEVEAPTPEQKADVIESFERPLTVSITLIALDYNANRGVKRTP